MSMLVSTSSSSMSRSFLYFLEATLIDLEASSMSLDMVGLRTLYGYKVDVQGRGDGTMSKHVSTE